MLVGGLGFGIFDGLVVGVVHRGVRRARLRRARQVCVAGWRIERIETRGREVSAELTEEEATRNA